MNTTNPDVSSVTGRRDGFLRAMKEFPDIQVVGIDYNLDTRRRPQRQTAAVLQAHPDLKGIFGTNLFSAQGAYQAVVNAGLTGAVKIASWDATHGPDQRPQGRARSTSSWPRSRTRSASWPSSGATST